MGARAHEVAFAYRMADEDERPDPMEVPGTGSVCAGDLPDLRDPATLGCLLALVREAHGPVTYTDAQLDWDGTAWWAVRNRNGDAIGSGATEAEALVAALERAP